MSSNWWRITGKLNNLEHLSALLFEFGAEGVQEFSEDDFECFFNGGELELSKFEENIKSIGAEVISSERVIEENWLRKCEEIWQPVLIGNLRIVPVLSLEEKTKKDKKENDILLLPGQGFGTGHHHSTRFMIEHMQSIAKLPANSGNIIDVGCGSGILALAANKIFSLPVLAIDNDPIALNNARENIELNDNSQIELSTTALSNIDGKFSLILSNIYAEVLISMRQDFERLLCRKGYLILSGIMSHLLPDILSNFSNPTWQVINEKDGGGWAAVLFKRNDL